MRDETRASGAVTGGRRGLAEQDPWRPRVPEKALLVAVELTGETARRPSRTMQQARLAAARRDVLDEVLDGTAADGSPGPDGPPGAEPAGRGGTGQGETGRGEIDASDLGLAEDGRGSLSFEASVAEFEELARSAGAELVATLTQRRMRADAATLVGSGKLVEIEGVALSSGADVVLFNRDLTPSQLRNLEGKLPCRVIDRTQLILDIFARHARTREGHLQVELAQLEYQLPRLAGRGKAMSQLGGGIGTRGPGETKLETDRRRINARIDHLKAQIEGVRRIRRQQRQRREGVPVPVVALVGYTNAGKSTLFNALTDAGVLESARMFATLDPKLKQIQLPSRRKVLLSDTVGFIADLPPSLVSSFRATLEEVERAELLLHVEDAASENREEQRAEVLKVLRELDCAGTPVLEVLNKIDLLPEARRGEAGPDVVETSGLEGIGLGELLERIDGMLTRDPLLEVELRVPQSDGRTMAAIEAGATLELKRFEGNLAFLRAVGPASLLRRYRRYFVREAAAEARPS